MWIICLQILKKIDLSLLEPSDKEVSSVSN